MAVFKVGRRFPSGRPWGKYRGQMTAQPPALMSRFDHNRNFWGGSSYCSPVLRGAARRAEGFFFPKFHMSAARGCADVFMLR